MLEETETEADPCQVFTGISLSYNVTKVLCSDNPAVATKSKPVAAVVKQD